MNGRGSIGNDFGTCVEGLGGAANVPANTAPGDVTILRGLVGWILADARTTAVSKAVGAATSAAAGEAVDTAEVAAEVAAEVPAEFATVVAAGIAGVGAALGVMFEVVREKWLDDTDLRCPVVRFAGAGMGVGKGAVMIEVGDEFLLSRVLRAPLKVPVTTLCLVLLLWVLYMWLALFSMLLFLLMLQLLLMLLTMLLMLLLLPPWQVAVMVKHRTICALSLLESGIPT